MDLLGQVTRGTECISIYVDEQHLDSLRHLASLLRISMDLTNQDVDAIIEVPFQLLDLPAEIRNMIFDAYIGAVMHVSYEEWEEAHRQLQKHMTTMRLANRQIEQGFYHGTNLSYPVIPLQAYTPKIEPFGIRLPYYTLLALKLTLEVSFDRYEGVVGPNGRLGWLARMFIAVSKIYQSQGGLGWEVLRCVVYLFRDGNRTLAVQRMLKATQHYTIEAA